jgi:hypothetical protein
MRFSSLALIGVIALVVVSCGGSAVSNLTNAERVWCVDLTNDATFTAVWDAADAMEIDSIGDYMLELAGISTDVDPRALAVDDLTDEEFAALEAVGEEFDASEVMWVRYLATDDGAKACAAAYSTTFG